MDNGSENQLADHAGKYLLERNAAVMKADALRKQLKLGDGGDVYLFGTTLRDGEKVLVVTRKCTRPFYAGHQS